MQEQFSVRLYNPGLFTYMGGAEKYTATIAQYLAETYKGLDAEFVAYRHIEGGPSPGIGFLNQRYGLSLPDDIKVRLLDDEKPGLLGRFVAHRRLRATSRDVDLYINCFHNVHFFNAKKNVHLVHFPAQRRVEASPTFSRNAFLKPFGAVLDRRYEECYDLFICNSRFTEDWLARYWGVAPERRTVLYPPVAHTTSWSPELDAGKENIILLVSRFDPRKNMLEAVEYFAANEDRFSGWRLVVAGSCGDKDGEYYARVALAARGHRVDLRPNLTRPDLDKLYLKARIFWHAMGLGIDENERPIDVEHFGITTVEAMSAGAVPVVIDKGGQREIVDDGVNGLRWRTLEELGNATKRLIDNTTLRKTYAAAAVEKSNAYSLESFYHAIDAIFREHRLIPEEYRR